MLRPLNVNFLPEDPVDVTYQLQDAEGVPVGAVISEDGDGVKKWAIGTWRSFNPELVDTAGAVGVLWSGRIGGTADVRVTTDGDQRVLTSGDVRVIAGGGTGEMIYRTDTFDSATGGGGLDGPSVVTLTFVDADLNPVPYVVFEQVGVGVGQANAFGIATFGSSDGTFDIHAFITNGIAFPVASVVVSGDTAATITGSASLVTPIPSAPIPYTDITMDFVDGTGKRFEGGILYATLVVPGNEAAKTLTGPVLSDRTQKAVSGSNGRATLRVLRNTELETEDTMWRISSSAAGFTPTEVELTTGSFDAGTVVT